MGWVIEPFSDAYCILPAFPDRRRKWGAVWTPYEYKGKKIYVPSWAEQYDIRLSTQPSDISEIILKLSYSLQRKEDESIQ